MPPVRSVQIADNSLTIRDKSGTRTLTASMIPLTQNTVAKVETWINTWLAANLVNYQARVHVFALSPLRVTVGTWNAGLPIEPNWWQET